MNSRMSACNLGSAIALLVVACSTAPQAIAVVARDYALTAPDSAHTGDATFTLDNRGAKDHELMVGLLRLGAGSREIVAAHQRGLNFRQLTHAYLREPVAGILYAPPGAKAAARIIVNLQPGQTYVLFCQLRDTVGAQQHAALGMFHLLHVR